MPKIKHMHVHILKPMLNTNSESSQGRFKMSGSNIAVNKVALDMHTTPTDTVLSLMDSKNANQCKPTTIPVANNMANCFGVTPRFFL